MRKNTGLSDVYTYNLNVKTNSCPTSLAGQTRQRRGRGRYRHALSLKGAFLAAVLLQGCIASSAGLAPGEDELAQMRLAYADEPYDVRLVDRSRFEARFEPAVVPSPFAALPGTIIIVPDEKFLYLIEPNGVARRYGVAVGASGHAWAGTAEIARKAEWPAWHPTDDMRAETPGLPHRIEPGAHNPLGARALYLYQNGIDTLYRIHGTSEPWTIGTDASSGCIRMFNEDVIDLYERVSVGATVHVVADGAALDLGEPQ